MQKRRRNKPEAPCVKPEAKRIPKSVKAKSEKTNPNVRKEIVETVNAYGACKDYFLNRFSGIRSMTAVTDAKKLRTKLNRQDEELRKENKPTLAETFGISNRIRTQALFDACMNLNSMWSNLSNRTKIRIRDNPNLSAEERSYCLYVLSSKKIWQAILLREDFVSPKKLSQIVQKIPKERFHYLHNMLRRITRKNMPAKPRSRNRRCMLLDQDMYSIRTVGKTSTLELVSLTKGKRSSIKLKGVWRYAERGNIQVVLIDGGKHVEVHKCVQAKTKKPTGKAVAGVDKGHATLLSFSSGNEYGVNAGAMTNVEADRITIRNTNRNHLIQKHKDLCAELKELRERKNMNVPAPSDPEREKVLIKKIRVIEKNNLGRKKYDRQHGKAKEEIIKFVNAEIRRAFKEEQAGIVVKEDLSFVKDKKNGKDKSFSAKARARLSSWMKGVLNDRMEYIAEENGIKTIDVNPAYTSQFCAECGSFLLGRTGAHKEIAVCPVCGRINANVNAAKIIKARRKDKEITLYTPYGEVKKKMLERAEKQAKARAKNVHAKNDKSDEWTKVR